MREIETRIGHVLHKHYITSRSNQQIYLFQCVGFLLDELKMFRSENVGGFGTRISLVIPKAVLIISTFCNVVFSNNNCYTRKDIDVNVFLIIFKAHCNVHSDTSISIRCVARCCETFPSLSVW